MKLFKGKENKSNTEKWDNINRDIEVRCTYHTNYLELQNKLNKFKTGIDTKIYDEEVSTNNEYKDKTVSLSSGGNISSDMLNLLINSNTDEYNDIIKLSSIITLCISINYNSLSADILKQVLDLTNNYNLYLSYSISNNANYLILYAVGTIENYMSFNKDYEYNKEYENNLYGNNLLYEKIYSVLSNIIVDYDNIYYSNYGLGLDAMQEISDIPITTQPDLSIISIEKSSKFIYNKIDNLNKFNYVIFTCNLDEMDDILNEYCTKDINTSILKCNTNLYIISVDSLFKFLNNVKSINFENNLINNMISILDKTINSIYENTNNSTQSDTEYNPYQYIDEVIE